MPLFIYYLEPIDNLGVVAPLVSHESRSLTFGPVVLLFRALASLPPLAFQDLQTVVLLKLQDGEGDLIPERGAWKMSKKKKRKCDTRVMKHPSLMGVSIARWFRYLAAEPEIGGLIPPTGVSWKKSQPR